MQIVIQRQWMNLEISGRRSVCRWLWNETKKLLNRPITSGRCSVHRKMVLQSSSLLFPPFRRVKCPVLELVDVTGNHFRLAKKKNTKVSLLHAHENLVKLLSCCIWMKIMIIAFFNNLKSLRVKIEYFGPLFRTVLITISKRNKNYQNQHTWLYLRSKFGWIWIIPRIYTNFYLSANFAVFGWKGVLWVTVSDTSH